MNQIRIFIELSRLNKPIGFMLLFWPCAWGLAYAYSIEQNLDKFLYFLLLFFLGSVLMRSAGCIVNDIVDKDIDIKVQRTKKRPLPANLISIKKSLIYVFLLCSTAFVILIQFNKLTIILGLSSMVLAFSYPYMKRFTYWPQLFLGLTFNWGVIMAWTSITGYISYEIIDRQLGRMPHKQGTRGHYDESTLIDKRRNFMEWWSSEIVNQGLKI